MMELMSPAGNKEALYAAVESGADAVYLGLNMFNARRPARNFKFDELEETVAYAHSKGVRVYIALNIDLKSTELADAAKILIFIKKCRADAVIVKDLALIYLIGKYFEPLEFHLSTQFGIANSAAMSAAEALDASRAVLARELDNGEISALVRPYFPKAEIFVQGSMCFSFSGKCLMSSWFGGKSANRGTCQAPCRFRFGRDGSDDLQPYFSMKDLNLSARLKELEKTGVAALKIEGRLKSAEWVGGITRFYRSLLNGTEHDGADPSQFSGREQGEGFYGSCDNLITSRNSGTVQTAVRSTSDDRKERMNWYDLKIVCAERVNISISTVYGDARLEVRLKKLVDERRGVYLSELEERLRDVSFGNLFLGRFELDTDILISKSQLNNIISDLGSLIAPMSRKEIKFLKSVKLPHKLDHELRNPEQDAKNTLDVCFENANLLRISSGDIEQIIDDVKDAGIKKVIVTEPLLDRAEIYKRLASKVRVELSMFPIMFENELQDMKDLIKLLEHTNNISYEVNDLGHLELLKGTSKKIDCGHGLSPYNFLAVKKLKELGLASAHIPFEADMETIEGIKLSPLPLRMTVYSRMPLFYSRAESDNFKEGDSFTDRQGFKFFVRKYKSISIFTSAEHFTIEGTDLKGIRAHEIIIDLTGEEGILKKFRELKKDPSAFPGRTFNLNRKLF